MRRPILALFALLWALPALAQFNPGFGELGFSRPQPSASAACTSSHGVRTSSGGNTIITLSQSDTLVCPNSFSAQVLVIAGGGSGNRGGGGAGGYCTTEGTPTCGLGSSITVSSGSTTVTVGTGGAAVACCSTAGNAGTDSIFDGVDAKGGGGGAYGGQLGGSTGGSGGGASNDGAGNAYSGLAGTSGQGFAGGNIGASTGFPFSSAGGGGANAAAANVTGTAPTAGGAGVSNSISGGAVVYAGGGGVGAF